MEPLDFGDIKPNEKRKSYLIDKWEFNLRNMSLDIIVDPAVCVNNDIVSIQVYSKYMMVEVDPEKVTTPYPGRISIPVSQLGGVEFEDIKVMNMTVEEKERDMGLACNCSLAGTEACKACSNYKTYFGGGYDMPTTTSSYPPNTSGYVDISELTNKSQESLKEVLQNTNKLIFDLDNRLKDVYGRITGKEFTNTPSNDLRDNGESIYSLCQMNREGLIKLAEIVEDIQKRL